MKNINDLKIGTRLNLVFNLAFIIIVALLGTYTITSQRKQVFRDTDTRMYEQVNDLAIIIEERIAESQKNTNLALKTGEFIAFNNSKLALNGQVINAQVQNQETKETQSAQLKGVNLGNVSLYNSTSLVDEISSLTGAVVTILQKIPQGYVRISTSVKQADGTRVINTYVPNSSPVAAALDRGEEYQDRAMVVNEWYLTAYKPYLLSDGTKIVIATGIKEKDMGTLHEIFLSKKYFETGYPYLVDNTGMLIIHPNNEGSSIEKDDFFKEMLVDDDGYGKIEYVYEGKVKEQYYKLIPSIDSYVAVTLYKEEFMKVVRSITYAIIIAVLIGSVIFIIITTLLSRSITSALKKGVEFAKRIAQGDLTVDLKINQQDEIGELAGALSSMLVKLKDIMMNIRSGAESIASASAQISNGSQQLSQGATEQASSTEEISSSMEEMVSNIQQNTDNAKQTENISGKASESMGEMSRIGRESFDSIRTIAEKITIVNDIAFQTNLLALNAAVEAARAGEHGRGFAVVAAEVRKLAERSKLAADEIQNLSKNSLKITEKTRESLDALVPEIQKTSQLVQEITAASIEQNSGADQINGAIQQLNIVVQQNAAASEEMATSAEELSSQAESLKDAVSFFKTEENAQFTASKKQEKTIRQVTEMKRPAPVADKVKKVIQHEQPVVVKKATISDADFERF
ncbi:MAG: Cache 3/Cache 2 fusion domain-containing protein [Bacteroidales bacterium]|nr:Cache 3/Cache 2 fusion domain-containing protein [Bacteroidales bacterium]